MPTVLLLISLFSGNAHDLRGNGWARDYVHYGNGEGLSSYATTERPDSFEVHMRPMPDAPVEEPLTFRDVSNGIGFGFVLALMVLVPLGSTVVFLRPRGVTWCSGSQRISRAEARAMLGRL